MAVPPYLPKLLFIDEVISLKKVLSICLLASL